MRCAARSFRAAPLLIATALALTACPQGDHDPPENPLADADAVLALATRGGPGPQTVAIEARASQYSDRGALKGDVVILVRRPASVHFSALSPTDDLLSVLATDGTRFTTFDVGGDACFVGDACAENVGRLVAIAMEADELAGVLIGQPPIIDHAGGTVIWDREVGAYRVTLEAPGQTVQRVWVSPKSGRIVRATLTRAGKKTVDLTYEDWKTVDGHALPHTLKIQMARDNTDLQLKYREVDVDLPLDDKAFAVPCPEGSRVEELPCATPRERAPTAGDGG